jgi:hypothetical protein
LFLRSFPLFFLSFQGWEHSSDFSGCRFVTGNQREGFTADSTFQISPDASSSPGTSRTVTALRPLFSVPPGRFFSLPIFYPEIFSRFLIFRFSRFFDFRIFQPDFSEKWGGNILPS